MWVAIRRTRPTAISERHHAVLGARKAGSVRIIAKPCGPSPRRSVCPHEPGAGVTGLPRSWSWSAPLPTWISGTLGGPRGARGSHRRPFCDLAVGLSAGCRPAALGRGGGQQSAAQRSSRLAWLRDHGTDLEAAGRVARIGLPCGPAGSGVGRRAATCPVKRPSREHQFTALARGWARCGLQGR
jgi:hypothetical protein